ncbi:hypothetical protein EMCRGX_G004299 [Ephydatia muelleri]
MASKKSIVEAARDFVSFVNKGPSPYHVVDECKRQLLAAGYSELRLKDTWEVQKGGKYFVVNNFSSIYAFAVGGQYKAGNGFSIVGAHTDSPCFRLKPRTCRNSTGYLGVGVQPYGGGIWHTWFDRDLKLAGQVVTKTDKGLLHQLVHVDKPILKIPNICIHLARDYHSSFAPNLETHTVPVLATTFQAELEKSCGDLTKCTPDGQQPLLLKIISDELGCSPANVVEFELCLADVQPAVIGGALEEFIFAPRLDNLMNCYAGLKGLIGSDETIATEEYIRVLALFDNEEVGSLSAQGAESNMMELLLRRICAQLSEGMSSLFEVAVAKSFLISADQAHAVHPNYSEKHECNHQPGLHKGPVLKFNANQKYATTAVTAAILREVARKSGVPLQEMAVRNDGACGTTIGPIVAARLGLRTVDIGGPQLSMHSIRETCCTSSVLQCVTLFKEFYKSFPSIDASFTSST